MLLAGHCDTPWVLDQTYFTFCEEPIVKSAKRSPAAKRSLKFLFVQHSGGHALLGSWMGMCGVRT